MVTQTWIEAAAYPNQEDAQAAVRELLNNGFDEQSVSVLYTDAGHTIKAGAINGAIWGGVLGALFGFLFPPIKGDTLVIVHAMNEEAAARARSILAAHNPRPEAGRTPSGVVSVAPQA